MNDNGCYNCEERHIGCHTNCKSYKEYKLRLKKINEKKQAEKLRYACHKRSKKVYVR